MNITNSNFIALNVMYTFDSLIKTGIILYKVTLG